MWKRTVTTVLIVVLVISSISEGLIRTYRVAEAAQVTIDSSAEAAGTSHIQAGSQTVFVSDQVGYKFYRDSGATCVYSKSTDGGATWNTAVTADSQTDCIGIQVWYDRWTPDDTGNNIHILTYDTSADDLFYNRLDTTTDTLLLGTSPVSMVSNTAQAGSLTAGENSASITKGTDGTIYAVSNDGSNPSSDSYIVECSTGCNLATGWTETGLNPLDNASDANILMPLTGGSIMLINRDISADDIRTKIWNNTSWSGAWTTIDANAPENATYDVGMAAAVSSTTPGHVYLAYIANNATPGTDDVIRTARYNGTSWASTAAVLPSTTLGLTNVAIGVDSIVSDVYVAYSGRTTAGTANTANVYWKQSTSTMSTWSTEQGPVNTSADDIYGVDLNVASDQRLYVSFFDNTDDDIYGDTIADIFPGIHASSSGSQITTTNASTTNVYLGGKFLLYNNYKTLNVNGITITESGSIDGSTNISNVKLYYENDIVSPFDCQSESYAGGELQFGSTDSNGFSGADGTSAFTGTSISVSTTSALCVYVVLDILDTTPNNATINVAIANPATDVSVVGSTAGPSAPQDINGTTQVLNDQPTLSHYHWRNDDGAENAATSKTGGTEDTVLTAMKQGSTTRLRIQVTNEGGSTTPAMQYRLEYATDPGSCAAATEWTDVGGSEGNFDMSDSSFLTNGSNTTNISLGIGGVSDPGGRTFLTPNGGVRDTTSQSGGITLATTEFVELEYAIVASTSAAEGSTYCFRVTDQGKPLYAYTVYPRATIAADAAVTALGTQTSSTPLPATNFYIGGKYAVVINSGVRNLTSVTLTENGTVDGQTDLANIRLYYDLDVNAPFDCVDETYGGGELQFGTTDADGFSGANGTSTFTGSLTASTTRSICLYTVIDTTASAQNGETIDIIIASPSSDVTVSGGASVSPTTPRDISGETTLQGAVLTQTRYHWRDNNGSESAATSITGGAEDTPVSNIAQSTPVRLRTQVSNEGTVISAPRAFTLEYGTKISSCDAVGTWINVGDAGGAWDMYDSIHLTDGENTTNIAAATGGVTDENTTFLTPNSAVKDASSTIATTTLASTDFIETEFSMKQTVNAGYATTYCFRVSTSEGVVLNAYSVYPELTTAPERDFKVQRGTFVMSGTTQVLTADSDYDPVSASTSAFIRITNSNYTGAGDNSGSNSQNADDITVHILNPSNIESSVTFVRTGSFRETTVSWEIVEFIGEPGSDNEFIVRSQSNVAYGSSATYATGTTASVADDDDVVVFITGQSNPDTTSNNYASGQSTAAWNPLSHEPVFTRGDTTVTGATVSYAVVEFTGINWLIQRSEHTFSNPGTTETEPITAINSISHAFVHAQKRVGSGLIGVDEFGHEVWISSVGFVSYFLAAGAGTTTGQTSVAWVIENLQTTAGEMNVIQSIGDSTGGAEPLTISTTFGETLADTANTSLFVSSQAESTGTNFPRPIVGATIASTTAYEIWRSDTGSRVYYRVDLVEWPTAGLALRQNYYRLYVDNNTLDPTDPWPNGGTDLGENTALTATDEPLGEGEHLRIRMSIHVQNSTFPAGTRAFKLQYGRMITSCSAITESNWFTLGSTASSTLWRGYDAPGTIDGTQLSGEPPTPGDLNLTSISDVAGSLEEINNSTVNVNAVQDGDDIEYDWFVYQNGAFANTYYCFRMVESDGTLLSGYNNYPQIRTADYTPTTQNWRWFGDETNPTPTSSLAAINVAPVDIVSGDIVVLRVTVKETKNIARDDVKFKLQYSEYADFSTSTDVVASTSCSATSTWCYANAAGTDNTVVASTTLNDVDSCVAGVGDGCGTYNESATYQIGFRHENGAATEYSFAIEPAYPRVNTVYYFRLYDLVSDVPVSTNTGESYPSLVTEGASLTFGLQTIASSTVTEGVTIDVTATATSVPFGRLNIGSDFEAAQRFNITTNAPGGYQLYMVTASHLTSASGDIFIPLSATNAAPSSWSGSCTAEMSSCFGYHTGDDTLSGGSTRFAPDDTYARFSTTTLDEVLYTGGPVIGETTDVIYRIRANSLQSAGQYTTGIRYISVPVF